MESTTPQPSPFLGEPFQIRPPPSPATPKHQTVVEKYHAVRCREYTPGKESNSPSPLSGSDWAREKPRVNYNLVALPTATVGGI